MAYYALEPWGAERDNVHAGIVAKAIYDVNADPRRRARISPTDFLLRERRDPTPDEMWQRARMWAGR